MQVLNETYSEGLRMALSRANNTADDAAVISIDRLGADVRVRRSTDYVVERLTFSSVRSHLSFCIVKSSICTCHAYLCFLQGLLVMSRSLSCALQHVHTLEEALQAMDTLLANYQHQRK